MANKYVFAAFVKVTADSFEEAVDLAQSLDDIPRKIVVDIDSLIEEEEG